MTTPFDAKGGAIDTRAFRRNLARWSEARIAGFVIAGSTGEAALLDEDERSLLLELARDAAPSGMAVVAGAGGESTRGTVRRCRDAAERGAEAVLVRPPAYYRDAMTDEALRAHFLAVADASPVPVILYHIPRYVPVDIGPQLAGELSRHQNIVAVKDSSGDLRNLGALCEACAGRAEVLVGSGAVLYPGLELGASGGILAVALLAPEACAELLAAWERGESAVAGGLQERIGPLHKRVVGAHGVPGIKHALDRLGLYGGPPRAPLLPLGEARRSGVESALRRAGPAVAIA